MFERVGRLITATCQLLESLRNVTNSGRANKQLPSVTRRRGVGSGCY
jgi:hypothetical protein